MICDWMKRENMPFDSCMVPDELNDCEMIRHGTLKAMVNILKGPSFPFVPVDVCENDLDTNGNDLIGIAKVANSTGYG